MARRKLLVLLLMAAGYAPGTLVAAEALVAVAANFATVAARLKQQFESSGNHSVRLASGSTGKLFAQISNGAPFDVLLAADQLRPARLENDGKGMPGSRFTYAQGRLAIWIPSSANLNAGTVADELASKPRIAMANPELAPYGAAALETLNRLQLLDRLADRLAMGENVAQAYAMVASGAAQAGLVAWSHIVDRGRESESWLVPADWHTPIRQDAILLRHGADNAAAQAFMAFLQSEPAQTRIRQLGYPEDS